jgi:hypothetical protein
VNTVMNFRVPLNAGNFLTSWEPVSFSRRTLLHGVWVWVRLVPVDYLVRLDGSAISPSPSTGCVVSHRPYRPKCLTFSVLSVEAERQSLSEPGFRLSRRDSEDWNVLVHPPGFRCDHESTQSYYQLRHVMSCLSVHVFLSIRTNSALMWRISMTFDVWAFFENL